MTPYDLLLLKIDDLGRIKDDLPKADSDFVDDMAFRFQQRQFVGPHQIAKVLRLWAEHCKEATHVREC